jgi:hypothetical protein
MELDKQSPIAVALADRQSDTVDTSSPHEADIEEFNTQLRRIRTAVSAHEPTDKRQLTTVEDGYFLEHSKKRIVPIVVNGSRCELVFTECYEVAIDSAQAAELSEQRDAGAQLPDISNDESNLRSLEYALDHIDSGEPQRLAAGFHDTGWNEAEVFTDEEELGAAAFSVAVEQFTVFCDGVVRDLS